MATLRGWPSSDQESAKERRGAAEDSEEVHVAQPPITPRSCATFSAPQWLDRGPKFALGIRIAKELLILRTGPEQEGREPRPQARLRGSTRMWRKFEILPAPHRGLTCRTSPTKSSKLSGSNPEVSGLHSKPHARPVWAWTPGAIVLWW